MKEKKREKNKDKKRVSLTPKAWDLVSLNIIIKSIL